MTKEFETRIRISHSSTTQSVLKEMERRIQYSLTFCDTVLNIATDAICQLATWSCPNWDLHVFLCWNRSLLNLSCVRLWIANIHQYFCFVLYCFDSRFNVKFIEMKMVVAKHSRIIMDILCPIKEEVRPGAREMSISPALPMAPYTNIFDTIKSRLKVTIFYFKLANLPCILKRLS